MADYENLLDSIDAVIKSNNRREITGQILQNTLHQMVGSLGENYQLAGFATPTLDPNSPDQNVFYVTDEAGVYTNFDNITLGAGLSFLMWKNEEWTSKTLDIVTADWVDEHYVSKAFLRKVFQFFDEDGVEIFPNDTESVVDNIKAMCGLWTNEYLSALGLGEGSTIPTTLAALNDVTITNPQDGQALVYDAASLHWVNATIQSGVDMSVVWAALAGATNEQINVSHLTTALNDYVTATSLATTLQSYVTTSALATELANYASQSWVETNYVSKAFFNSLFEAQDVNGNAITPNNSGQTTIDRLKILVGAYTEQYLSALGLSSGGGGGGSSTLAGLNDVTITNPQDGQFLIYDAQSSHWVNGAAISMSAVWTALAAATSEQINSSHLTTALSGYVTTSALASELANYVTTSNLATTLADYVTTSALATTLADYGSKTWIDNNYVSKAFFNRLFQAFAPLAEGQTEPTQVEPNDTTTTIDNIKAMFGFWTEQYLSALGLSAGGGHTIGVLNDLNDVTITNPQTNQVLKYNGTQWVNAAAPSGVSALSELTDVAISSLADKDLLQWDYATGKWKNVVLSAAMSGYATTSQLANFLPLSGGTISGGINPNADSTINLGTATAKYHYIYAHRLVRLQSISKGDTYDSYKLDLPDKSGTIAVTSDIPSLSGYATESWVGQNYLPLSGGTINPNNGKAPLILKGGRNEFREGLRVIPYGGWSDIVLCGGDAAEDSGTSANTWFFGNNSGNLYITRNGSDSGNAILSCVNNSWSVNGYVLLHSGNISSYAVTSLSGYATTSWVSNNYLPLSGGTLSGANFGEQLIIERTGGAYYAAVCFKNTNGIVGYIGTPENGKLYRVTADGTPYLLMDETNCSVSKSGETLTVKINNTTYSLTNSTYNFSGTSFYSGNNETAEHNCDSATANGLYYYTSNGPSISLGASTNDGALYVQRYSSEWVAQMAQDYRNGRLFVRSRKNGDWQSWKRIAQYDEVLPNTGGTVTGNVGIKGKLNLLRSDGNNYGRISFYSDSYDTWFIYMQEAGLASPTSQAAPAGTYVNDWALRTLVESVAGFGWTWESCANASSATPSIKMELSSQTGNLKVYGDVYAVGGVTALSDERLKDVYDNISLSVEKIANAPAIRFYWKADHSKGLQAGTLAQYWQKVLPEVVSDRNNELGMQYGVTALVSVVGVAREVLSQKEEIEMLKNKVNELGKENEYLREEISRLKVA